MSPEVITALIQALGTILVAIVGTASVVLVAGRRGWATRVARSGEAYYLIEAKWVKLGILASSDEMTDVRISNRRGSLRREIFGDECPAFISSCQEKMLHARYFNRD